MRKVLPILFLLTLASSVHAGGGPCFEEAGKQFGVPPELLLAIAQVESNQNPRAFNVNPDGSMDHGLMQINERWLRRLEPYGMTLKRLYDPCASCMVAAWILRQNLDRLGLTWDDPRAWKAVGAYNASSPGKQSRYIRKVYEKLNAVEN